ncbi:hypothetical protein R1flu_023047 [Riccia fluitans]|uniref:Uncharacterized protein n=1 Tax=Riccia fluitans TaxID=41844 RepID=A0ABD1XQZ2_9MARC
MILGNIFTQKLYTLLVIDVGDRRVMLGYPLRRRDLASAAVRLLSLKASLTEDIRECEDFAGSDLAARYKCTAAAAAIILFDWYIGPQKKLPHGWGDPRGVGFLTSLCRMFYDEFR